MIRGFVEVVLDYIEATERERDSILNRLIPRLVENDISGEEDIYTRVTNWVDKMRVHHKEETATQIENRDVDGHVYDLVGEEDGNLALLKSDPQRERVGIREAVDSLRQHLDPIDLVILEKLLDRIKTREFLVSPDTLVDRVDQIRERVKQIAGAFQREGRVLVPTRPIIYIEFNPLYVRYGRRNYGGNPLAFFLAHQDVYEGMTKNHLKHFDEPLYQALWKSGQLDVAIPEDQRRLPEVVVSQITEKLKANNGNVPKTSRELEIPSMTVRTFAQRADIYNPSESCKPPTEQEMAQIISAYETYGGNATKAEKHFRFSRDTIRKYWRREGLVIPRHKLTPVEVQRVVDIYPKVDGDSMMASRQLPYSYKTISRYWRREGLIA